MQDLYLVDIYILFYYNLYHVINILLLINFYFILYMHLIYLNILHLHGYNIKFAYLIVDVMHRYLRFVYIFMRVACCHDLINNN